MRHNIWHLNICLYIFFFLSIECRLHEDKDLACLINYYLPCARTEHGTWYCSTNISTNILEKLNNNYDTWLLLLLFFFTLHGRPYNDQWALLVSTHTVQTDNSLWMCGPVGLSIWTLWSRLLGLATWAAGGLQTVSTPSPQCIEEKLSDIFISNNLVFYLLVVVIS